MGLFGEHLGGGGSRRRKRERAFNLRQQEKAAIARGAGGNLPVYSSREEQRAAWADEDRRATEPYDRSERRQRAEIARRRGVRPRVGSPTEAEMEAAQRRAEDARVEAEGRREGARSGKVGVDGLGKLRDVTNKPRLRQKMMKEFKDEVSRKPTQENARLWYEGKHPEQEKVRRENNLGSSPAAHKRLASQLIDKAQDWLVKARKGDSNAAAKAQSLAARAHAEARGANSGVLQKEALKLERQARRWLLNELQGVLDGGTLGGIMKKSSKKTWKKVGMVVAGVAAVGGAAWAIRRYRQKQSSTASMVVEAPAQRGGGVQLKKMPAARGGGSRVASMVTVQDSSGNYYASSPDAYEAKTSGSTSSGATSSGSTTSPTSTGSRTAPVSTDYRTADLPTFTRSTTPDATTTIRTAVLPALAPAPTPLQQIVQAPATVIAAVKSVIAPPPPTIAPVISLRR